MVYFNLSVDATDSECGNVFFIIVVTLCSVTVFVKLNEQGGEGSDVTNVTNVVSKTGLKVIQHFQLSL